jgi:hypothetical protein
VIGFFINIFKMFTILKTPRMRKFTWLIILLTGTTSVFVFSCKKKDKTDTCSLTEANFAGSYKIQSVKYKASATSPEIDGATFIDACVLDDVTTFNTNNTYTYTDAGTTCSPGGDDSGTWSISGSKITVNGEAQLVENFSCSSFTISDTAVDISGDKISFTFKKQ